jgi:hypothetical protein
MKFESANPSVVKSIKQRVLLNAWLRARRGQPTLPSIDDFQTDGSLDELSEMMGFNIEGLGDDARFLITQQGARIAATYGNEHIEPARRINRYLDEAIGPERYARLLPCYRTCLSRKRPIYSISTVRDADGKDVSYERLLLPFGRLDAVEQIVGSYKAISIEGGFRLNNLMSTRPKVVPAMVIRAVIDHDFVPAANRRSSGDAIEPS